MSTKAKFVISAALVATVGVGFWLGFGKAPTDSAHIPATTPTRTAWQLADDAQRQCADKAASGPHTACPEATVDSSGPSNETPPSAEKRKVKFGDPNTPLRAMIHQAQLGNHEATIEMALSYIERCGRLERFKESLKRAKAKPDVFERLEQMNRFCEGYEGPPSGDDIRALTQKWRDIQRQKHGEPSGDDVLPGNKRPDFAPRIARAVGTGDGDLILARVNEIPPDAVQDWLLGQGFKPEQLSNNKRANSQILNLAVRAAVCERYGCDTEWHRVTNCTQMDACTKGSLTDLLRTEYEATAKWYQLNQSLGPQYARWDAVKASADALVNRLASGP